MLNSPKLTLVQELITGASREELIWLSGYLAGIVAQRPAENALAPAPAPVEPPVPAAPAVSRITIAYGTETGNSKKLATDFAAKAKKKGIQAKLVGLEQYRLADLSKEEYFLTVISTQGDGEPPAAAKKFYDHIHQGDLRLDRLKFSVLALGDTAYPLFCKAGEDVDQQLHKIGGQRIASLLKCDTDYEADAGHWFDEILQQLNSPGIAKPAPAPAAVTPRAAGRKIYSGTILTNIDLNDRGSAKHTHHLEIAAEGVDYQPGDSIGIVPENPAGIIQAITTLTRIDPGHRHFYKTEDWSVADLLRKKLNIVYLPERVVKKYAAIVRQDIPQTRIGLLDLLKIYPVKDSRQFLEVISILEPTAPRLYSISSSPDAHPGEIHLTVARDIFSVNDELKYGLCSDVLSQLAPGQTVEFHIHHNSQFRLPAPDKDIIMIGPGTGIAPFRAFLAERDSTGAPGKNWLFFGDQHFTTDFLYQSEIQDWARTGVLTRINTAFSRDQEQKVYVQHKMRKHATELFRWLESGAHVYVCGAKEPMSVDVEDTLLSIIRQQGDRSAAQAESFLNELKESGRYLKDVY
ncbi:MAG TPA: flavodoxin domain-containing protein [Puia sp.]|jgi:sulfite reductase (NADPH) flavoprotein alpha-component|nr:flavodoxin domain-containing protein [Puia sp.]